MKFDLYLKQNVEKKIVRLTKKQKKIIVQSLDLIQCYGSVGEPLSPEINIWICRRGPIRIIYKIMPKKIIVLEVLIGWEDSLNQG